MTGHNQNGASTNIQFPLIYKCGTNLSMKELTKQKPSKWRQRRETACQRGGGWALSTAISVGLVVCGGPRAHILLGKLKKGLAVVTPKDYSRRSWKRRGGGGGGGGGDSGTHCIM